MIDKFLPPQPAASILPCEPGLRFIIEATCQQSSGCYVFQWRAMLGARSFGEGFVQRDRCEEALADLVEQVGRTLRDIADRSRGRALPPSKAVVSATEDAEAACCLSDLVQP